MRKLALATIIILLFFAIGCQGNKETSEPQSLESITLAEAYPGDIRNVDKVELLDGSSGERKVVEDRTAIQTWINQIKDIPLSPDYNQEERVGYVFGITLYEGDERKLGFIPTQINGIYYESNPDLDKRIRTFFEQQFGRPF